VSKLKVMQYMLLVSWLCFQSSWLLAASDEPTLTLVAGNKKIELTRAQLLQRSDLTKIVVEHDPSYPDQVMTYEAIPLAALFAPINLPLDAVIEFKCRDGFAATISQSRVLNADSHRSVAYVAVERLDRPWPRLKKSERSAGPFYLIWAHPELSAVTQEEWPFQLAGFAVKGSLQTLYPGIFPVGEVSAGVKNGFASFVKNCFPCHTINKSGPSELGPDLNVPYNVTEYISAQGLRTLIRNPQALRYFPRSQMSSFPTAILPDAELEDLIRYLTHMTNHKIMR
jgi:mono/diheme cytochrome c family protein